MRKPKYSYILVLSLFLLLFVTPIYAHPGNTASDGCHYCRTNCASWGEVEGERHCHGGSEAAPAQEQQPAYFAAPIDPTATTRPWPTWTPKPLVTRTPKPQSTSTNVPPLPTEQLTSTPEPTTEPTNEVLGVQAETPTPAVAGSSQNSSTGGTFLTLLLLGGGGYWLWKKRKLVQPPVSHS